MDAYLKEAQIQAARDVREAVLRGVIEAMKRHGQDPNTSHIVAAGFAMAARELGNRYDPEIPKKMCMMLRD